MTETATDILEKMPDVFDMELYPIRWDESMNTVLAQELGRFNGLIKTVRQSLVDIRKAVKGVVVMSTALETMGQSLYFGTIPVMWKADSYPSLKPLGGYVADLIQRLDFLGTWLKTKPPPCFWLSGFFFTQAFLTGTTQNFARRYTIPIDSLDFEYVFEKKTKEQLKKPPKDGVFTYGLFIEGARWDKEAHELAESRPKVLFEPGPVIWLKPTVADELPKTKDGLVIGGSYYNCPVYKTGDRRGVLATTGHSTNFVMYLKFPSTVDQGHWIERGVACLTQLND